VLLSGRSSNTTKYLSVHDTQLRRTVVHFSVKYYHQSIMQWAARGTAYLTGQAAGAAGTRGGMIDVRPSQFSPMLCHGGLCAPEP
jgi:hypothetical protein